jgi:hypothetical protein
MLCNYKNKTSVQLNTSLTIHLKFNLKHGLFCQDQLRFFGFLDNPVRAFFQLSSLTYASYSKPRSQFRESCALLYPSQTYNSFEAE